MLESAARPHRFNDAMSLVVRAVGTSVIAALCMVATDAVRHGTFAGANEPGQLTLSITNPEATTLLEKLRDDPRVRRASAMWRLGDFRISSSTGTSCDVTAYGHTSGLFDHFSIVPPAGTAASGLQPVVVSDVVQRRCLGGTLTPATVVSLNGRQFLASALPAGFVLGDPRPRVVAAGAELWIPSGAVADAVTPVTLFVTTGAGESVGALRERIESFVVGGGQVQNLGPWMRRHHRRLFAVLLGPACFFLVVAGCVQIIQQSNVRSAVKTDPYGLQIAATAAAFLIAIGLYAGLSAASGLVAMASPLAVLTAGFAACVAVAVAWQAPVERLTAIPETTAHALAVPVLVGTTTAAVVALAVYGLLALRVSRQAHRAASADAVWTGRLTPDAARHTTAESRGDYFERVLLGVRRASGVRDAALSTGLPGRAPESDIAVRSSAGPQVRLGLRLVSSSYFRTLGLSVSGREFSLTDGSGPAVGIINQAGASHIGRASARSALAAPLLVGRSDTPITVVGVVDDGPVAGPLATDGVLYFPFNSAAPRAAELLVRLDAGPLSVPDALVRAIGEASPLHSIERVVTLPERLNGSVEWLRSVQAIALAATAAWFVLLASALCAAAPRLDALVLIRTLFAGSTLGAVTAFTIAHRLPPAASLARPRDDALAIAAALAAVAVTAACTLNLRRRVTRRPLPSAADDRHVRFSG